MFNNAARTEWKQHWPIVLGGIGGMAMSTVPAYTTGVFMAPLEQAFGWTRAAISSGALVPAIVGVFAGPLMGLYVDRLGPRRVGVAGVLLATVAMMLLATATSSIWIWWLLWFGMSVGATLVKPTVWSAGVSSVFTAGRGFALAVTMCGTGVASSLTPIISEYLVDHLGWRMAYVGVAALWFIVIFPLVFFLFTSAPDEYRRRSGEASCGSPATLSGLTAREGLRSWRYFRLAVAGVAMVLGTVSCVVSFVPILVSLDHSRPVAASVAGVVGVTAIIGRLTGGYLLDRINANGVAAVCISLPIVSCLLLLFLPHSMAAVVAAAVILGLSLGGELDAVAYLTSRHFGLRNFGVFFGMIGGLQAFATGFGPLVVNYIYDLTKSYELALWLFIPVSLVGAAMFLSLGPYPSFPDQAFNEGDDAGVVAAGQAQPV